MWDWIAPRATDLCLLVDPSILWLRNVSDLLIGSAYAIIPFALASFLSERRDIQFGWLAWCFALFIALCGATHWMHIWLAFFPHYTMEAYLKAATALASVTTAGAVIGLLPDIKRLPTPAMLAREHKRRIEVEVALRRALEERSNRELQKHIETQDLLIQELNHRVKNTLTSVQAMARMSFKSIGPTDSLSLEAFEARLFALSTAHNLLTESNWTGASLADLVRTELSFGTDLSRVTISGPPVELTARETVSLALVIHELATNAMKYGALRNGVAGRSDISWTVEGENLRFRWSCFLEQERIAPPTRQGFGLRMIRQAVERELAGTLRIDWERDGLKMAFVVPLEKLGASSEGNMSEAVV